MELSVVIRIAAVGIIVAVLNSILTRSGRDDYALMVTLAGIIAALMMLIPQFFSLMDTARELLELNV